MSSRYYGPNRLVCNVLSEMRKLHKTRNYSGLLGLVEEAQTLVNRMEAALYDQKDLAQMHEEKSKIKKELKALEDKKEELEAALNIKGEK